MEDSPPPRLSYYELDSFKSSNSKKTEINDSIVIGAAVTFGEVVCQRRKSLSKSETFFGFELTNFERYQP